MAYFSNTLNLTPSVLNHNINGLSPFSLSINTALAAANYKVYKIVWEFDDGSEPIVIKLQALKTALNLSNLNIPQEPGDPRNEILFKKFFLKDSISNTFKTTLKIFWIQPQNIATPNFYSYNINLNLTAPKTGSNIPEEIFVQDIHLSSTRMFGPDNKILYNFESLNPNYLLPVIVTWKPDNYSSNNNLIGLNSPTFRPYKLLPSVDMYQ